MSEDTFPGLHSEKIVVTDSERLQAIHIASCRAKQLEDLYGISFNRWASTIEAVRRFSPLTRKEAAFIDPESNSLKRASCLR